MTTFSVEIVTPTRVITEESVFYLRCPGVDGSFGVMADHAEAIIALSVGFILKIVDILRISIIFWTFFRQKYTHKGFLNLLEDSLTNEQEDNKLSVLIKDFKDSVKMNYKFW